MSSHPFQVFLSDFIPQVQRKFIQANKAFWILETTGSSDAADLKADLDAEFKLLFHQPDTYRRLLVWERDPSLKDPVLKRELNVLIRMFKQNQIPEDLLRQIALEEAALSMIYASFRPTVDGCLVSENDIREILRKEKSVAKRKAAWEASKKVGEVLAPKILSLVELRNKAAQILGYSDFFKMQLDLQEVDSQWLFATLDNLSRQSDSAYQKLLKEIEIAQCKEFCVQPSDLGPWAWSEPFCQEDPLDVRELDALVEGVDIPKASAEFYKNLGFNVDSILSQSDMYERPQKSQHAFCIHIDRRGDIRTLNNVKNSIKWLETVLHELGHAVYEAGLSASLPWLLREPPHMIPTEAMALLAGRQAYRPESLARLVGTGPNKDLGFKKALESLRRRQLIFSRWVLIMTEFERRMYENPLVDLNDLWWSLVQKHQKIKRPPGREGRFDWAAKYHIGLAPVYYFSYLLGEMFASALQEAMPSEGSFGLFKSCLAGRFLNEKLFALGNSMPWSELAIFTTGKALSPEAWVREFA